MHIVTVCRSWILARDVAWLYDEAFAFDVAGSCAYDAR